MQPATRLSEGRGAATLVDLNRAGVPLLEIVTEPDLRSPDEASAYLVKLQQILRYLGVSTADMEKGAMRCEANVSVRPVGQAQFGTKVEVKNLNSFRSVKLALEYEVGRQIAALKRGERDRPGDDGLGRGGRSHGRAAHQGIVRRLPLLPGARPAAAGRGSRAWVDEIRGRLVELPDAKIARYVNDLGLDVRDARVLAADRRVAEYFETALSALRSQRNQVSARNLRLLKRQETPRPSPTGLPASFSGS